MGVDNSQYDAIMRTYAAKRAARRSELEARTEKIYKEIPALYELDLEVSSMQAARARAAIGGNKEEKASLAQKIAVAADTKQGLLAAHGYTLSDLEIRYDCPDCRDTGYLEDGSRCHCLKQAVIRLLYKQSHLEDILGAENFDTLTYNWYDKGDLSVMQRIVKDTQDFVETFDSEFRNLLLLGEPGTGKTFLANCVAKALMDRCKSVVYLTAFELFDLLAKAAFSGHKQEKSYQQSYEYLLDCDLLIIDDLGTEMNNSFVSSQLFLVVNERILRKKSTLISSNLSLEAFRDAYSERTLSRVTSSYRIWRLPGSDIRMKKKLGGQ